MSLLRQLLLSVTLAITAILIGVFAFSIETTRTSLDQQLQSESDNAGSALALLLAQPSNQDAITRKLLMRILYDSGKFRKLVLVDPQGDVLFQRIRSVEPATPGGAPEWFGRWLLAEPQALYRVQVGDTLVGHLTVVMDNAYAYDALWRSTVRLLALVLVAGLAWSVFVVFVVRWLQRALHDEVAAQVRAIGDAGAVPVPAAPARASVPELAQVVRAIADTRERVRATAQEQDAKIESLQLELNLDAVTGLANRKYFVNELRRALESAADAADTGGTFQSGRVLVFRLRDLAAINTTMSRASVDEWLRSAVERVQQVIAGEPDPGPQLARLNGSDFVVLMSGYTGPQAMLLAQRIRHVLLQARVLTATGYLCRWALALTDFMPQCDVSRVLSRLDHGLMNAESAGRGDVEYVAIGEGRFTDATETQWRALLHDALEDGRMAIDVEPVVYRRHENDDEVRHCEASLVLRDGDQQLSGSLFMPVAVRLGMSADCDLRAIRLGLEWLAVNDDNELVVKVSLPSLAHPQFLHEVQRHLQGLMAHPSQTSRLTLELDAHGLLAYADDVQVFCSVVRDAGSRVGLRRLAQQPAAIMRLHLMKLDYVKLGGDFIDSLGRSTGGRQMLMAIVQTAATLGIQVFADDARDPDVIRLLHEQGVYTC